MNADFINELLKKADPYIREYGSEEGYKRFRKEDALSMSKSLTMDEITKVYIDSINNGEAEAPFYSRTLLSMYVFYEQKGIAPQILKEWVLERLLRISEGEDAKVALSLRSGVGQKRTKPMYNQLRCACFIALKRREGMNESEAVEAYVNAAGVAERHAYRLLDGIEIVDEISDKTLIFFRDHDVSDDYSPY